MARSSDTRQRIQHAARELFRAKGVRQTSLQEIAERLGITKPALYYHFGSREELIRSIVQPLIEEMDAQISELESRDHVEPRTLLEEQFDAYYERRDDVVLLLTETTTIADLGLIEVVVAWRERLTRILFGPNPTLAQSTRAVVAIGGLSDCAVQFTDVPRARLREAAVDAACAALGTQP